MREARWTMGLFAAALAVAAPVWAVQVQTAHPPGVDYTRYQTYRWAERPDLAPNHPLAEGSPLDRLIRTAGDRALAAAGYKVAESGAPDLRISYVGYVTDKLVIEGVHKELADGVAWIGDPQAHSQISYQEGTLVIEIRDAKSDELVWSGWASDVANSPERLRKKAEKAAFKILKNFPPEDSR
jgi:Domain of unknown function (DUF4136)